MYKCYTILLLDYKIYLIKWAYQQNLWELYFFIITSLLISYRYFDHLLQKRFVYMPLFTKLAGRKDYSADDLLIKYYIPYFINSNYRTTRSNIGPHREVQYWNIGPRASTDRPTFLFQCNWHWPYLLTI